MKVMCDSATELCLQHSKQLELAYKLNYIYVHMSKSMKEERSSTWKTE